MPLVHFVHHTNITLMAKRARSGMIPREEWEAQQASLLECHLNELSASAMTVSALHGAMTFNRQVREVEANEEEQELVPPPSLSSFLPHSLHLSPRSPAR